DIIRTYLTASARQNGFVATPEAPGAGMAITDRDGRVVAASPGMTVPREFLDHCRTRALTGEGCLYDGLGAAGAMLGFAVPVLPIEGANEHAVGLAMGLRPVAPDLHD